MAQIPATVPGTGASTATRIGKDARLKGTLRFKSSLRFSGYLEGVVESSGYFYVDKGAVVKADVYAQDLVLAGEIHGNIHVTGGVDLLQGSRIYGNIKSSRLRIADGVVFEGKCEMIKSVEGVDVFSSSLKDLRRSIRLSEEEI